MSSEDRQEGRHYPSFSAHRHQSSFTRHTTCDQGSTTWQCLLVSRSAQGNLLHQQEENTFSTLVRLNQDLDIPLELRLPRLLSDNRGECARSDFRDYLTCRHPVAYPDVIAALSKIHAASSTTRTEASSSGIAATSVNCICHVPHKALSEGAKWGNTKLAHGRQASGSFFSAHHRLSRLP